MSDYNAALGALQQANANFDKIVNDEGTSITDPKRTVEKFAEDAFDAIKLNAESITEAKAEYISDSDATPCSEQARAIDENVRVLKRKLTKITIKDSKVKYLNLASGPKAVKIAQKIENLITEIANNTANALERGFNQVPTKVEKAAKSLTSKDTGRKIKAELENVAGTIKDDLDEIFLDIEGAAHTVEKAAENLTSKDTGRKIKAGFKKFGANVANTFKMGNKGKKKK
jgi:hypothetical protein